MSVIDRDFLRVKPGDIVVVQGCASAAAVEGLDWWVGHVIHVVGGARNPCANSLFQAVCVDTGAIRTVNADLVKGIIRSKNLDQ